MLPKGLNLKKKLPKKKPKLPSKIVRKTIKKPPRRKCSKCGEDDLPGHECKKEDPVPIRKKPVGLRTYYNIAGKKVHDQQTQTPVEMYPKILQIRADLEAHPNFQGRNPTSVPSAALLSGNSVRPPKSVSSRQRDKSFPSLIRRNFLSDSKQNSIREFTKTPKPASKQAAMRMEQHRASVNVALRSDSRSFQRKK